MRAVYRPAVAEEGPVPLSEHEQRLLEQMERALYAEDPKLASALRGADLRAHYRRRAFKAVVGFILGIVLLLAGVVTQVIPVSILGFVIMLAAALFAVSSWRRMPGPGETAAAGAVGGAGAGATPRPPKPKQKARLMDRVEERWRRRREQDGR